MKPTYRRLVESGDEGIPSWVPTWSNWQGADDLRNYFVPQAFVPLSLTPAVVPFSQYLASLAVQDVTIRRVTLAASAANYTGNPDDKGQHQTLKHVYLRWESELLRSHALGRKYKT